MQSIKCEDGKQRCSWCATEPELSYHDSEWGFPVADDRHLFEKICLESFQSGLSWRTILVKRENFRAAFDNFELTKMASYNAKDIERLLANAGIVRHKGKIEAVINNAQRAGELVTEFGSLAAYFWQYEPEKARQGDDIPATTAESIALAKDLKKRGWKFVGPTTAYAFMQSMGLVNDHLSDCISWPEVDQARASFTRPS